MEPGGADDDTSYAVWQSLGGGELIDCRAHHLCSGYERWHGSDRPPTQPTWRRLIQLLLAYKGESTDMDAVSRYQRDHFGATGGETAVIELSALHAPNLEAVVEREIHRDDRIGEIRARLELYQPRFAVFYGTTYRDAYGRVAGTFGKDGTTTNGRTLCIVVPHPTAQSGPPPEYWIALGHAMRRRADGDINAQLPDGRRSGIERSEARPQALVSTPTVSDISDVYQVVRAGNEVGRILYDGWKVRVERLETSTPAYALLGYYENTRPPQWPRKTAEIDDVFDAWCRAPIDDPSQVKVAWRARQFVPAFNPPPGAINAGCAIVEEGGIEVARVYKLPGGHAQWVAKSER
jgi:hypothetical protein